MICIEITLSRVVNDRLDDSNQTELTGSKQMVAEDRKGVVKPTSCVKGVSVTGWWVGVTGS